MSSRELYNNIQNEVCNVINREYQKLRTTQYKGEIIWKYALVILLALFLATLICIYALPEDYRTIGYGILIAVIIIIVIFLLYNMFKIYNM